MYCKQCGKEIKEGAAFCIECGFKVTNMNASIDVPTPKTGDVCSKCGAALKEGSAFCNACGAPTNSIASPYEAPKKMEEKSYSFKIGGFGSTYFHLTPETLVVNQTATLDKSIITCIPYCVISKIQYQKRKILPVAIIVGAIGLLFLFLMLCIRVSDFRSDPSIDDGELKFYISFIYGFRILLVIMLAFLFLNACTTVLTIFASNGKEYVFDMSKVKKDKEKEFEALCEELGRLINVERSEEEKKNNTILIGNIQKDTKSSGMELLAHLEDNVKRNEQVKS